MAEFDLIVRGGQVVNATGAAFADVAVRAGQVVAVGAVDGTGEVEIDASQRLVMPGGVDVHAHIEQMSGMGLMNADTFETATRSAAFGGTTSVISFAAQEQGQTLRSAVSNYHRLAQRGAMIDHAYHMIIRDTDVDALESDIRSLAAEGHRSIKIFTTYNIKLDDAAILRVMRLARRHGLLVCVHAENDAILQAAKSALLERGMVRPEHHALSHPRIAEIEAVSRICHFAEMLDQPVMLFHISTHEALQVVSDFQARGVPVRAETCPHYLLMTADILRQEGLLGAKWMCSPPQRTTADQTALWDGLKRGDLQVISSDHAPYRFDETGKLSAGPEASFAQIANGLPGLETRLPLMFDAMVSQSGLGLEAFVALTATQPAALYGLETKGKIAPGFDADIVIWDPAETRVYGADDLHDNVGYNPWVGRKIKGWPETVILRGTVIIDQGVCHAKPGQGQWLKRERIGIQPSGAVSAESAILVQGDAL